MNNSYSVIRAIRGPITLITLGVLFSLHNFTRYRFDQTWPVLLIVFGLLSLMQRGAAPPPPPMPPPPPRPFTTANYGAGYAQSPYSQPVPPVDPGPAKGGFGSSAPPRFNDPITPGNPPEGGAV